MNTVKWLVKREYWEHKGGFLWTPAIISAIMSVVLAASLIFAYVSHGADMRVNGIPVGSVTSAVTVAQKAEVATMLSNSYMGVSAPLFVVLGFVSFFFFLGCLYDERKDRSILFWKSLPVSDAQTVGSKVIMGIGLAPLITLVLAALTSFVALVLMCIMASIAGVNIIGAVLSNPQTYLAPFEFLSILPIYILWSLPTVGWLMMVSAWSKSKPFLWAVGAPVLVGVLLGWFNALFGFNADLSWFWRDLLGRGLFSLLPGSWFGFVGFNANPISSPADLDAMVLVAQSWKVIGSWHLWVGAVIGSGMIYASSLIRRWKDEG